MDHVSKNFVEASVVGVGLPHDEVADFAARLNLKKGERKVEPQKYYGGAEIRKESGGGLAYVALTVEGAGYVICHTYFPALRGKIRIAVCKEVKTIHGCSLLFLLCLPHPNRFNKPKDVIASALAQRVLGSGPRTKRGLGGGGLAAVTKDTPVESAASGFSASYSDSGLLGVFITASSCCVEQV